MNSETIAAAELACARLLNAYAIAVDAPDGEALLRLFTPDGLFLAGPRRLEGLAALATLAEGRPAEFVMRHLLGTVLVTVESEVEAGAVAYYTMFRGNRAEDGKPTPMGLPFSMGEWHARFRLTPEGWAIARLEVRRLFSQR